MSKELKQEYIENECKKERNPEKWAKFLNSHYSDCLKIDGYYLPIEKEKIQKSFCFGYGQNGVSTEEEYKNASEMETYASKSEKYFMQENLEGINQKIISLEYFLQEGWENQERFYKENSEQLNYSIQFQRPYLLRSYTNKASVEYISQSDFEQKHWLVDNKIKELTNEEIKELLNASKLEKENFTKRLNTYLKKYGTSKLRTWTYLVD